MPRLMFLGNTTVDVIDDVPALPAGGGTVRVTRQTMRAGGCALNACRAAVRAGADCALMAPVGRGLWGEYLAARLREEGIRLLAPRADGTQGCFTVLAAADGAEACLGYPGEGLRFEAAWFDSIRMADWDMVYLCGLDLEGASGGVLTAALTAEPPRRLFFAPAQRILHIPPERMAAVMRLRPILHMNAAEATSFAREDDPEGAALRLHALTGRPVVVTLGADGCLFAEDGAAGTVPSAGPAVPGSAVGAGDAHAGALMAGLSGGMPLRAALAQADAAARRYLTETRKE